MDGKHNTRALIETVHLYNGNYGGIVQAWALQQVLSGLGVEAWTDVSKRPSLKQRAKDVARPLLRRVAPLPGAPGVAARFLVNAELDTFVRTHLRTVDAYGGGMRMSPRRLERWDAFVVGSDQVWRPAYTDVRTALLDFAAASTAPKIAYAASFGTSDLSGWSPDLLADSRRLAREFDAISVRERSGVDLCRAHWGVEATPVLDPTLLLDRAHYDALIERAALRPEPRAYVFDYTLDTSDDIAARTAQVASDLGVEVRHGITPSPPSTQELRRSPTRYVKTPVEAWLRGFRDADFVVTDSFHGTVFSILFERPFVSVLNSNRGADRFHSLLDDLGLEDRLVRPGDAVSMPAADPDWEKVRARLAQRRADSTEFLSTSLRVLA